MDFIDISLFLSYNIYRQQCMLHRKSITVRRGTMIEQLYVDLNLRPDLEIIANDGDFDWVIVSQTLQEMRRPDVILQRIVRVGKRAAVSFINFGHIACRLQLLATGRMPRNKHMPYEWFDTPNIHFGTLRDFRYLCKDLGISIVQATPVGQHFPLLTNLLPNLFAVGCVFVIEKKAE